MGYERKRHCGGVCLIWTMFGTSHVARIPEGKTLIETLTLNGGLSGGGNILEAMKIGHFKSIVRPERVSQCLSPHYCYYSRPYHQCLASPHAFQINHYWSRDEYYFENMKIPRRLFWGTAESVARTWVEEANYETSQSLPILRFVEPLRKRLGFSLHAE